MSARTHAARVEELKAHVRAQRAEGNRLRESLRSAKLSRALALELMREGAPRRLRLLPWLAAIAAAHFAIAAVFFAYIGCVRRGAVVPPSLGLLAVLLALVSSLVASRPGAGGRARPVLRQAATMAALLAAVVLLTLAGRPH